ncbi:MAG: transglycosylase domain-containing protein [Bacteroidota bacterium]
MNRAHNAPKERQDRTKRGERGNRRFWIRTLLGIGAGITLLMAVWIGSIIFTLPDLEDLQQIHHPEQTRVIDRNGEPVGSWFVERRSAIDIESLPPHLIHAILSIEDVRFYEHNGVDRRALMRVAVRSLLLQQDAGGGSTITQQLAKNLFPRQGNGIPELIRDKMREMILARRIEQIYSKDEILELYLNTVSFGEDTFGIETAANRYFGRTTIRLEPHQSALLAGLLQAPSARHPIRYPERALERRNVVLRQMSKYGFLEEEDAAEWQSKPLDLDYHRTDPFERPAPHLLEHLRVRLQEHMDSIPALDGQKYDLYRDGLVVETTLDRELQQMAEIAFGKHMDEMHDQLQLNDRSETARTKWDPALMNGGVLLMDPHNGEILVWVGGAPDPDHQYDQVRARRQTGSTFKPILYASAISAGVEPCDYRRDQLRQYEAWEEWTPKNVNEEYGGYWSLQGALAHSVNTIAVDVALETGLEEVNSMAQQAGLPSQPMEPSMALGTGEASLMEMSQLYGLFATGGIHHPAQLVRAIFNREGNLIYEFEQGDSERRLPEELSQTISGMLAHTARSGTAAPLTSQYGISVPLAGKTGTTQNARDGWFVGYTPDLVIGVRTGWDRAIGERVGGSSVTALPLAGTLLREIEQQRPERLMRPDRPGLTARFQSASCEDYKDEGLRDRLRSLLTGQQSDEPERVPDREEDRRSLGDRLRSLFSR